MKKLRMKYPVPVSIALCVLFPLASVLGTLPVLIFPSLAKELYLAQLLAEISVLVVMTLAMLLLGMRFILRRSAKTLPEKLLPCLPLIVIYFISMLVTLIQELHGSLEPPLRILWYVLCMLAVGAAEELTFRGLITRMLFVRYRSTAAGVWFSVLFSSLLFGLVHLTNAAVADMGGVLVQVAGAAVLGICLSAIYLRTGSLWTVALLHAFMDFCGLASSGLFGTDALEELVGSYNASNLAGVALYLAIGLFLLRPSKMKLLTDPKAEPSQGQIIALMAVVALFAGLLSCVTVMSV